MKTGDWQTGSWVVLGMGVSGVAAIKLLHHLGARVFAVNQGPVETWAHYALLSALLPHDHLKSQDDTSLDEIDSQVRAVILSPGIPRDHAWLQSSKNKSFEIINEMELGFRVRPMPILALTGTNGKTTTTTLLGHILKHAGKAVFVGGNIGKAYCQAIMEEISAEAHYEVAVLEVSSFQLESLFEWRALHSTILNITPSHGERYHDPKDYALAKSNLISLTDINGTVFIPAECELLDEILKRKFSKRKFERVVQDKKLLVKKLEEFLNVKEIPLLGEHNWKNTLHAALLAQSYGLDKKNIAQAIKTFKPLAHRCEPVWHNKEKLFINDSKSTNWDSTLTAVTSLSSHGPITLVIGGKLRGRGDVPDKQTVGMIKKLTTTLILFGEAAKTLHLSFPEALVIDRLEEMTKKILPGFKQGVLLFSPAYPSFDHYENYEERGEHFRLLINQALA